MKKQKLRKINSCYCHSGAFVLNLGAAILYLAVPARADLQIAKTTVELSQSQGGKSSSEITIKENQVVELNKNLKNAIEENQRLTDLNKKMSDEMEQLKQEHQEGSARYQEISREKEDWAGTIEQVRSANRRYSQQVKKLEDDIRRIAEEKDQLAMSAETSAEQFKLAQARRNEEPDQSISEVPPMNATPEEVKQKEARAMDLLSRIDAFTEQDERLRLDSAKAHYNMGNIYFQKGEYEIAAREYYQAVTLMPDDPDSHYNLAFVSSEYLRDYKTALKHFQIYLYLNPTAKDSYLVKEKILEAKMHLRNVVDSPLENDAQ